MWLTGIAAAGEVHKRVLLQEFGIEQYKTRALSIDKNAHTFLALTGYTVHPRMHANSLLLVLNDGRLCVDENQLWHEAAGEAHSQSTPQHRHVHR